MILVSLLFGGRAWAGFSLVSFTEDEPARDSSGGLLTPRRQAWWMTALRWADRVTAGSDARPANLTWAEYGATVQTELLVLVRLHSTHPARAPPSISGIGLFIYRRSWSYPMGHFSPDGGGGDRWRLPW